MSETEKPELTHDREAYGCTIRYSFHGEYAVLTDRDGNEQEFSTDRGQIAQGGDSATLQALHAAKADQRRRHEAKEAQLRDERAAKRAAAQQHKEQKAPVEVAELVSKAAPAKPTKKTGEQ